MAPTSADALTPFFELSIDLLCLADLEGHFIKVNPAFEAALGISARKLTAVSYLEFVHPADAAATQQAMGALRDGQDVRNFRNRFRCADGSYRTLLWAARAVPEKGLIYAAARDITEIDAHEAELERERAKAQEKSAELAAFFELSPDIMAISDGHGTYFDVNPRFEQVLGWTAAEARATRADQFIHPDDLAKLAEGRATTQSGGTLTDLPLRFRCKDGSYRLLQWASRADLKSGYAYSSARDVTAEAARACAMDRLVRIFETSPDAIMVLTPDGRPIQMNATARRMAGIADGVGLPDSVVRLFPAKHAETVMSTVLPAALMAGSWGGELVMFDVAGRRTMVQLIALAHAGPTGEVEFLSLRAHDISGFKEAERIKDEFISTVSHELRTPLTSIRGSLGLIEGGALGEVPPKMLQMLQIANTNTDRLIRLINDVMDLEKMRSGRLELRREPVSLVEVAHVAVNDVQGLADARGLQVAEDFVEQSPIVWGDRDRLVQVVVNLLSNAVKFSPSDSTIVLRVAAATDEGTAVLSVTDQGSGIPPEMLRWIFERFTQVDSSDTRRKPGTGLGLAIASDIAKLHGGSLEVVSEPGVGSTFMLKMPVFHGDVGAGGGFGHGLAATMRTPMPMATQNAPAPPQLLVVEDDPQLSTVYDALLTGAGYRVRTAQSLDDARHELDTLVPDAILLDARLREGDGLDLLSELAQEERFGSTVVIVVSGSVERPAGSLPLVVDWIRKPTENVQLLSRLALDLAGVGKPRVLIVEDDADTALVVSELMRELGFAPSVSSNGRDALEYVAVNHVDLIILDVGLPIMDGYEFVAALKRIGRIDVPIIVYTGHELTNDQRSELTLGLTTYLTKTRVTDEVLQTEARRAVALHPR